MAWSIGCCLRTRERRSTEAVDGAINGKAEKGSTRRQASSGYFSWVYWAGFCSRYTSHGEIRQRPPPESQDADSGAEDGEEEAEVLIHLIRRHLIQDIQARSLRAVSRDGHRGFGVVPLEVRQLDIWRVIEAGDRKRDEVCLEAAMAVDTAQEVRGVPVVQAAVHRADRGLGVVQGPGTRVLDLDPHPEDRFKLHRKCSASTSNQVQQSITL